MCSYAFIDMLEGRGPHPYRCPKSTSKFGLGSSEQRLTSFKQKFIVWLSSLASGTTPQRKSTG